MVLQIILRIPEDVWSTVESGLPELQSARYNGRIVEDSHTGPTVRVLEIVTFHDSNTLDESMTQATRVLTESQTIYPSSNNLEQPDHSFWSLIIQYPKQRATKRLARFNRKFDPGNFHGPHQKFEERDEFDILRLKERTIDALMSRLDALKADVIQR